MTEQYSEYIIACPHCLSDFDALQAVWCSCDPQAPTKLCAFCLSCLCKGQESFREQFWENAPPVLLEDRDALKDARMLLGDQLVRARVISTDQLLKGLKLQKAKGIRLGEALVELNLITQEQIDEFLKLQHTAVRLDLSEIVLDLGLIREIGVPYCLEKMVLPLEREKFQDRTLLSLAMADPSDTSTINEVQLQNDCKVLAHRAEPEEIEDALNQHFPQGGSTALSAMDPPDDPGRNLALRLLHTGIERGAEDLFLLHDGRELRIRFRIGGKNYRFRPPEPTDALEVFRLIREMARTTDSGEGTIRVRFGGGELDLAVREENSPRGERIHIHIAR